MKTKVWYVEHAPFPREGLSHLAPDWDCPVNIALAADASRLARQNQLEPPADRASLNRFKKKLRARIWEKMGVTYDGSLPLDVQEFGTVECDGYTIRKVMYRSREDTFVTALLYVPEGEGPFPAVLQMHGHSKEGKFTDRVQALSIDLAKSGFVCLAVDAYGTFERAGHCGETEYHGGFLGAGLLNIGETLMGCQVVDNMRGIDYLQSLSFVKKDKIGATGASGGGNQTMWLAAMDDRVAAAMPVVSVGSFTSYVSGVNCICELLPDGMTLTEEAGVLALIAPRPLRIGNAFYDVNHTFAVSEMLKTFRQVQRVYWNLGAPDAIAYTVADRVHGMHDEQREAVLGWFRCWLQGKGKGGALPEPCDGVMEVDPLRLFPDPEKRPDIGFIDCHSTQQGMRLHDAYLARESYDAADARKGLAKLLRLRPLTPYLPPVRYDAKDGWERLALEAGDHLIPILMKPGTDRHRWKVLIATEGKANIPESDAAAAAADGAGVIAFDLFGTGETAIRNDVIGELHQFYRQLLWVGRSLTGEWVYDILAVARMLKRMDSKAQVTVRGWREAGIAALFAAALQPKDLSAEAVDSPSTYVFTRESIPTFNKSAFVPRLPGCLYTLALALPKALYWGDVSLAAALAGGAEFVSPRAWDGTPLTPEQERAFREECAAVKAKLR